MTDTSETYITYDGPSDFQEFGAADFKKDDIEQGKLVFERGVPKAVSPEVADALTDPKNEIFGDFQFSVVEDDEDVEGEAADAKKKAASKRAAAKKAAASQTSTGSQSEGSDPGPTGGNGSSTSGGTAGNGSSTGGAGA